MAFPSTLRRLVIALNGYTGPEYFQCGAAIAPGEICTYDDADEVKPCEEDLIPFGVIGCDADHDLSTDYDAGERVPVYPLGCGVDIYVKLKDPTTIVVEMGDIIEVSDTAAYDGFGKVIDDYVAVTTDTGDATGHAYTSRFWVGRAQEAGSITSAVARFVPVKLSL